MRRNSRSGISVEVNFSTVWHVVLDISLIAGRCYLDESHVQRICMHCCSKSQIHSDTLTGLSCITMNGKHKQSR